jgi:hypothetical protein
MSGQAINEIVNQLVSVSDLKLASFEKALATSLKKTGDNPMWTFFEFKLKEGPFSGGELRLGASGDTAFLTLEPRGKADVNESDLDLDPWGELQTIDINPRIPPEGADAYIFQVDGVQVAFQLTHETRRLRSVALEWGSPE